MKKPYIRRHWSSAKEKFLKGRVRTYISKFSLLVHTTDIYIYNFVEPVTAVVNELNG